MTRPDITEATLFVSYASSPEEKEYCRFPARVVPLLSENRGEVGDAISRCYEEIRGRPLMEELLNPTLLPVGDFTSFRLARLTQYSLFILALEVLRHRFSITHSAAFSAGYGPLFVAAGSLDPVDCMLKWHEGIRTYTVRNFEGRSTGDLYMKMFCSYESDDFSSFVVRAAADAGLDIKLKDDREPYAVQLAGSRTSLDRLVQIVETAYPEFETTSSRIVRTGPEHTNPEVHHDTKEALSRLHLAPPRFEIMTHGEGLLNGHNGAVPSSTVLFNASCAPLSMGKINRYLQAVSCPVIFLGSPRAARFIFYGLGPRIFSSPCFHWEDVLFSDDTISPLSLPQTHGWA